MMLLTTSKVNYVVLFINRYFVKFFPHRGLAKIIFGRACVGDIHVLNQK